MLSKSCPQCGAQFDDNAQFCANCGYRFPPANMNNQQYYNNFQNQTPYQNYQQYSPYPQNNGGFTAKAKSFDFKSFFTSKGFKIVVAIVVIAVVAVVVLTNLIKPYKAPFDKMTEGFNDGKFRTIMKALPDDAADLINSEIGNDGDEGLDEVIKQVEKLYGKKAELSCDIIGSTKLNSDQLDSISDTWKFASVKLDLSKGYSVDVRFTIKGKKNTGYYTYNFSVAKDDGNWCVVDVNNAISDYIPYIEDHSKYNLSSLMSLAYKGE